MASGLLLPKEAIVALPEKMDKRHGGFLGRTREFSFSELPLSGKSV